MRGRLGRSLARRDNTDVYAFKANDTPGRLTVVSDWIPGENPANGPNFHITITGLSVAVALIIGTIELVSIAADKLSLTGGPWTWVADLNLNTVGFVIVGLFVVTWVVALAVWRFGHIEEKWAATVTRS